MTLMRNRYCDLFFYFLSPLLPFLICFLLPFFPLLSLNNSLPSFFLFFQGFLFRPPFIPFHFCHSFLFFFSLLLSSFLASIPNSSHCSNFFLKCPPDSLAPSPNPSQILSLQKKAQSCHLSIPISARPSFSTGLDLAISPPPAPLSISASFHYFQDDKKIYDNKIPDATESEGWP